MLLSFLLGWWLCKYFFIKDDKQLDDLKRCREQYEFLENKYTHLKSLKKYSTRIVETKETFAPAKNPYDRLRDTNLKIIEGIGSKTEKVLQKNGIKNWSLLAQKTPKQLRIFLDNEDEQRFRLVDPHTWPKQAKLAEDKKWNDLIDLQKKLNKQPTSSSTDDSSKLENVMIQLGLLRKWKNNDLKAIEGIGPKIEELFHKSGIKTWEDLANSSVSKLKKVLGSKKDRFKLAEPDTWPRQAELANVR